MYFVYAGVDSRDMGIINVNLDMGLQEEPFLPTKEIYEISTRYSNTHYFSKAKLEPLMIRLICAFEDEINEDKLQVVKRWLGSANDFQELYFNNIPEKKFFVLYEGIVPFYHTGLSGYFDIYFRANSPFAYSDLIITDAYNEFPIKIVSKADVIIRPEVLIKKNGDGNIAIINQSTGQIVKLKSLYDNEVIYIDNDNRIATSNTRNNLKEVFSNQFLFFNRGNNVLTIEGNCQIKFRYREKYFPQGRVKNID